MWINKVRLNNFRNYSNQEIELNEGINLFYGENAQGKTNIIESIYLCSVGKSFRARKDQELIKFNTEKSDIEIEFNKSDRDGKIKIEIGNRKKISVNGIKLKKLSELLGNINVVIFTPDDIDILKGGPQKRRKFLDVMISQLKPNYMHVLNLYLKTLEQRNNYLRQIKLENKNENMLEIWDEKLAEYAIKIYEYRNEFINKIKNKIENIHFKITNNKEKIEIKYISNCNDRQKYLEILKERRKIDIIKGYTTKGIHRDDFMVYVNNNPVNVYGSQGQHRTAILSLKLSELNVVYDEIGEYPILLLDDFMSELDENRKKSFLKNVKNAQVIITCTEKMEVENLNFFTYNVSNGKIIKKKTHTK